MRRVKTLAPGGGVSTGKLTSPQPSDRFGAVGILTALTAAAKAASAAGLGQKIQALLKDEQRRINIYERRYKSAKKRFERAKTEASKRRNLRSMLRYRELMEVALLKRSLVSSGRFEPGVMLDGAAIESRRNALIKELEGSSPERKKHLEQIIKNYGEQLDRLQAQVQQATPAPTPTPTPTPSGSRAQYIAPMVDERVQRPPDQLDEGSELLRQTMLEPPSMAPDNAVVGGVGGLRFISKSPPGPGQQVRVSFYPTNPANSYAGANGIVVPGDDPVLLMRGTYTVNNQAFLRLPDFEIRTELMDFGAYRFLGLQCHPQGNYKVFQTGGLAERDVQLFGIAITVRSIQVYNGQELLLPNLGEMDVETFNLFPTQDRVRALTAAFGDTGFQQTPYNITRSDRFFVGLRTNPVIEGTARVRAIVSAYVYGTNAPLIGDFIEIPITFSIIGQMLEDKVFGNPVVVAPAARAGAQVNVGLRDEGVDSQGVRQYRLRNPRYIPPGE